MHPLKIAIALAAFAEIITNHYTNLTVASDHATLLAGLHAFVREVCLVGQIRGKDFGNGRIQREL